MSQNRPVYASLGRRAQVPTIARLMNLALERPGVLSLAAGFTDNSSLPLQPIARIVAQLATRAGAEECFQYGSNQGRPGLRRQVAARLLELEPGLGSYEALVDQIAVGNGSQQILHLAIQTLCEAGDIVLVDRPSYFVFLEMLKVQGIEACSIPVDRQGRFDLPKLHKLLEKIEQEGRLGKFKAVYCVSYFSNPSARSLDREQKEGLARVLSERGCFVPILEDAAYRELFFETAEPTPSVFSLSAWEAFPKLYLSTLTKSFATGLKVGWGLCSNPDWLSRILALKGNEDFGTAHLNQAICEEAIVQGDYDQQLSRVRRLYRKKMQTLDQALREGGLRARGWHWESAQGGLYLWLRGPEGFETAMDSVFCRYCLEEGVLYVPGDLCFGDRAPRNSLRLSFGVLGFDDLKEAARRFCRAVSRMPCQ